MQAWKKGGLSLALAFSLIGAPLTATSVYADEPTPAPAAANKALHYVAFGDSLTVGYEPGVNLSNLPYGFVDRVYEQALSKGRATAVNYGIAGLTSTGLKNFLTAVVTNKSVKGADIQPKLPDPRADQIVANPLAVKANVAKADLITITIGGNDFWAFNETIQGKSEADVQKMVEQRLTTYSSNLTATLQMIFGINPRAQVVVADQYNPVPNTNFQDYANLLLVGKAFTGTLEQVAQGFQNNKLNVRVVKVADDFVGREITYTHIMKRDIHPNQLGYGVMAEQFSNVIWGDYGVAQRQTPITIVVGGKQVNTYKPLLLQNSTYVPVREYSESLGAKVDWEQATRTAIVTIGENSVRLTQGSDIAVVGGTPVKLSAKVQMFGDKVYVPLRALAEGLGFDVTYVPQSHTAYVNR